MVEQHQIESAMKIYYYLLKEGELSLEKNKDLYLLYSDDEIKAIVEVLARESDVIIEKYNQVIYLIPSEENSVLGFKDSELYAIASSANDRETTKYLSLYIIALIITLFYCGKGNRIKSRDFMSVSEVVSKVSERLGYAFSRADIEEIQEDAKYNIVSIYHYWNALRDDDDNPNIRKSRYGYVRRVCSFLDKQNLLQYDAKEEDIRPTPRLTHLMSYSFLNKDRQEIINKLFAKEGEADAEN